MDAPGQWLAHVWVIRVTLVRGPPSLVLTPAASKWGLSGPAPHCPGTPPLSWSASSTLIPWSPSGVRRVRVTSKGVRGCHRLSRTRTRDSVTEHSSFSCVSFEDINTSSSSLCIVDDGDAVFIIPLSGYFYSHSPHWLLTPAGQHGGLLCVSLPKTARKMSHCQGK